MWLLKASERKPLAKRARDTERKNVCVYLLNNPIWNGRTAVGITSDFFFFIFYLRSSFHFFLFWMYDKAYLKPFTSELKATSTRALGDPKMSPLRVW